jgi:type IV secretion system protein VirB2
VNQSPKVLVTWSGRACAAAIGSGGVSTLAFAQANPFQTGAESLVTNFTAIATPIAVLAIMALAVVAMTGRISWAWPIGALVGIGVIFGAPTLVTWARGLFGV